MFPNIRNIQFDQSSPGQPNAGEKNLEKSIKKKHVFLFKKSKNFEDLFAKKNAIFLVLQVEEISLRPELSSPPRFGIQGRVP